MGPFEEEEEGTGVTNDVVKVKGAESGHPRSPDLRNDTGTAIFPNIGSTKQSNTGPGKLCDQVRVRIIDKLDEIYTNADDWMMLIDTTAATSS